LKIIKKFRSARTVIGSLSDTSTFLAQLNTHYHARMLYKT